MKNIRLLIVDDDEDYMVLSDLLKESDLSFEIDEVNSSKLALQKLKKNEYDCVVIDYLSPVYLALR